tara:strand:+ start:909 stop:1655 length:747 start_codon:yes stop_codon:yes gene_type:complete
MAAGAWKDWAEGELVTEALFQDIQDSIAFIYASESAANTALTNKVTGTQFYDTGAGQLKIWNGSAWQSVGNAGLVLLATATASGSSSIDFKSGTTGWNDTDYSSIYIIGDNITVATDTARLYAYPYDGASQATGSYNQGGNQLRVDASASGYFQTSYTSFFDVGVLQIGNATREGISFTMVIQPSDGTNFLTTFHHQALVHGTSSQEYFMDFVTTYDALTEIDGLEFQASTGNIDTGNFYLFGTRRTV